MTPAPLQGCRVLDLGIITAGAATSALLADMGAEVIKVESPHYRDPFRLWAAGDPAAGSGGLPPFFRATNRNKLGISLDLKHESGRAAFLRLVANSDIVVENFRRGVLGRLGLDYEALRSANPAIILASVSSQGETGPDAGYVSYGSTLEAVAGLAWLTGYPDGPPTISGRDVNYPDQIVAIFAAGIIATAWRVRRNGGGGTHLDLSQRELTSFLCGEAFLAAGRDAAPARAGNAQAPHRVQDCFRDQDGKWVAVTVDAADIDRLRTVPGMGTPRSDADLDTALRAWIASRPGAEAVASLEAAGIAAAPVLDGHSLLSLQHQLWDNALSRTDGGDLVKGFPFQLSEAPLRITRDAPGIGSHSAEILTRVAGYSPAQVAALARAGVIELEPG
ncbi:CaiB/BaiF CoA-transferase family protein [Bosea sp. (in: a-proteobacteria)]|uniref:CaiB/BaiF CoA transferase family protein n=1 Tax=Bosea sp. (in: a-proteobacteria) TaxID=1871050 RepID=UPI0026074B00|nr:CoA transferase [Bosea sp. (in: a-proteobacteria)]MCO5090226.1 CoA transferase [Bosea sp. (in: a-proteobacteria)]